MLYEVITPQHALLKETGRAHYHLVTDDEAIEAFKLLSHLEGIIPAKYLTEISKSALKPHLLEDLVLDGFDPKADLEDVRVIVARENFGCGSSRESYNFV